MGTAMGHGSGSLMGEVKSKTLSEAIEEILGSPRGKANSQDFLAEPCVLRARCQMKKPEVVQNYQGSRRTP